MTTLVTGRWPGTRWVAGLSGRFGHPAADIPTGGDDVSPLANDGILSADQYAWQITSLPGSGTLTATDAGAVSITGVSGSTTAGYTVYILRGATGTVDTQANTINFSDGSGAVSGVVDVALAALATQSASAILIDGQLPAGQLGALVLSASGVGQVTSTGVLSAALGDMQGTGAGQVLIDAEMPAGQLGLLAASAVGSLSIAASLGATLQALTVGATGVGVSVREADLSATLGNLALSATAELGIAPEPEIRPSHRRDFVKPWMPEVRGQLSATLDGVSLVSRGKVRKRKAAAASVQLEGMTLAANGVGAAFVNGMWRTTPRPTMKRASLEERVAYLESLLTRRDHHV